MLRASIITKVREKLDEVTPFDNAIVDDVDLIDDCLNEAATKILMTVPLNTIRGYTLDTTLLEVTDDNVGILPLPSDFLRIHTIKATGWSRAVTKAYSLESDMALLQSSAVTRGGVAKPVCVISYIDEGSTSDDTGYYATKSLYMYTVSETFKSLYGAIAETTPDPELDYIPIIGKYVVLFDVCSYVKNLLPEKLQDNLIDPLAWQCAGDVLSITGNMSQAAVCYKQVEKFIFDHSLR